MIVGGLLSLTAFITRKATLSTMSVEVHHRYPRSSLLILPVGQLTTYYLSRPRHPGIGYLPTLFKFLAVNQRTSIYNEETSRNARLLTQKLCR